MKVYDTERLLLRQIDENWVDEVLQYLKRNCSFLTEWEAQRTEEFIRLNSKGNFVRKILRQMKRELH